MNLLSEVKQGDRFAISRLISLLERRDPRCTELLAKISAECIQDPYIVSFVGPPGAGKSTLITHIAPHLADGERVAILSIEPSSPISGGSILGNRIRMLATLEKFENIYMRSFCTGSSLGGLPPEVFSALKVLSYGGYRTVLMESIGAGQLDYKPLLYSHTRLVVLTPQSGDVIQMIKAGVTELGDIYVINKSDQPGADILMSSLREVLRLKSILDKLPWMPPVILTAAITGMGTENVVREIRRHREYLLTSGQLNERLRGARTMELVEVFLYMLHEKIRELVERDPETQNILEKYASGQVSYFQAAEILWKRFSSIFKNDFHDSW